MKIRAASAAVVRVNGVPIGIQEGQAFDSSDEIVRLYPWLFEGVGDAVEQATAAPGQKRSTRRSS